MGQEGQNGCAQPVFVSLPFVWLCLYGSRFKWRMLWGRQNAGDVWIDKRFLSGHTQFHGIQFSPKGFCIASAVGGLSIANRFGYTPDDFPASHTGCLTDTPNALGTPVLHAQPEANTTPAALPPLPPPVGASPHIALHAVVV